jgi:hypothetical protein
VPKSSITRGETAFMGGLTSQAMATLPHVSSFTFSG